MKRVVLGVKVEGNPWKPNPDGPAVRIYFYALPQRGQACWDCEQRRWVKVHGEVDPFFKLGILKAFRL